MKKILLLALAGVLALGVSTSCKKEHSTKFYTVTFNSDGGSAVAPQKVRAGYKVTRPANPTRTGYTFANWYRNETKTTLWSFPTDVVNANVTLFAGWNPVSADTIAQQLTDLIADSDAITDEADFTAGSWDAFQVALANAKVVADKTGATSEELQNALDELQTTMDGLVDISILNTEIDTAGQLDPTDYTTDSWTAFQTALDNAKTVQANPDATQQEVDDTIDELETAFDNLVPATTATADKTQLQADIDASANLDESNYTADSWTAFQNALTDANTVNSDTAATQQQVDDADTALNNAAGALVQRAPASAKTTLQTTIDKANALNEADYTADSWTAMQNALTAAQNVEGDANATQAQVDAAGRTLQQAITALNNATIDKTALDAFIADAEQLNQNDYTADSWSNFATALQAAQTVSADPNATSDDITTAYNNLETATNALVLDQANSNGLVEGLVTQITNILDTLPSDSVISSSPLLQAALTPVLTTVDTIRDQLNATLAGQTPSTQINDLNTQINDLLSAAGLDGLI